MSLTVGTWLAYREGETIRAAGERQAAFLHVERAQVLLDAGEMEQAERELNEALRLFPDYNEARDRLTRLRATSPAEDKRGQLSTNVTGRTTDALAKRAETPADTLAAAQRAGMTGDWAGAVTQLETLRKTAPEYEPTTVTTLLMRAYMADGRRQAEQGQVEAALGRYKAILQIAPEDLDALEQRDLAQLYLDAVESWGADWPLVIEKLDALYQRSPDYADVSARLATAHVKHGEALVARQPCQAQESLARGLALADQPETRALLTRARQACQTSRPQAPVPVTPRRLTPSIVGTNSGDRASGQISGRVLDRQGRPLSGFEVTAQGTGGRFWFATTDRQGLFHFESLPPADYVVDIPDAVGPSIRIQLEAGKHILIDFIEP